MSSPAVYNDTRGNVSKINSLYADSINAAAGTLSLNADNILMPGDAYFSSPPNRVSLVENFLTRVDANGNISLFPINKNFELLGTNAALPAHNAARGSLALVTAGALNDQVIILPYLNQTAWSLYSWGTENQVVWESLVSSGAAVTTVTYWAGLKLTNTHVVATDADQVYFRYNAGSSANWRAVSSIGGVDTDADTGVVMAVNTIYHLKVVIDAARLAKFYINGVLVATTAALTTGVNLIPYVGINTDVGAPRTLHLAYEKISRLHSVA